MPIQKWGMRMGMGTGIEILLQLFHNYHNN